MHAISATLVLVALAAFTTAVPVADIAAPAAGGLIKIGPLHEPRSRDVRKRSKAGGINIAHEDSTAPLDRRSDAGWIGEPNHEILPVDVYVRDDAGWIGEPLSHEIPPFVDRRSNAGWIGKSSHDNPIDELD